MSAWDAQGDAKKENRINKKKKTKTFHINQSTITNQGCGSDAAFFLLFYIKI